MEFIGENLTRDSSMPQLGRRLAQKPAIRDNVLTVKHPVATANYLELGEHCYVLKGASGVLFGVYSRQRPLGLGQRSVTPVYKLLGFTLRVVLIDYVT